MFEALDTIQQELDKIYEAMKKDDLNTALKLASEWVQNFPSSTQLWSQYICLSLLVDSPLSLTFEEIAALYEKIESIENRNNIETITDRAGFLCRIMDTKEIDYLFQDWDGIVQKKIQDFYEIYFEYLEENRDLEAVTLARKNLQKTLSHLILET